MCSALRWKSMPNLNQLSMPILQAITPQIGVPRNTPRFLPLFAQTPPPAAAASDMHESAVRGCTRDKIGRRHNFVEIEQCRPFRPSRSTTLADFQVEELAPEAPAKWRKQTVLRYQRSRRGHKDVDRLLKRTSDVEASGNSYV